MKRIRQESAWLYGSIEPQKDSSLRLYGSIEPQKESSLRLYGSVEPQKESSLRLYGSVEPQKESSLRLYGSIEPQKESSLRLHRATERGSHGRLGPGYRYYWYYSDELRREITPWLCGRASGHLPKPDVAWPYPSSMLWAAGPLKEIVCPEILAHQGCKLLHQGCNLGLEPTIPSSVGRRLIH